MFERMFDATSIPVLSEVLDFTSERQAVLANNVANADTPGYRASDLPKGEFEKALARAVEAKRRRGGGLRLASTRHIRVEGERRLYKPVPSGGMVRLDGNDVSLDLELAKLSKNATLFQLASRLLAARFRFLKEVVRERLR